MSEKSIVGKTIEINNGETVTTLRVLDVGVECPTDGNPLKVDEIYNLRVVVDGVKGICPKCKKSYDAGDISYSRTHIGCGGVI